MKPATLFREYIWLINTIHRHQRLTFEEINQHWVKTDMSGGLPMARSTFNRHRDAIRVLSPQWLADTVKQCHLDAASRYE